MHRFRTVGVPFAAGFLVPVCVQQLVGWWLDSGRGVAVMFVAAFALAAVITLIDRGRSWRPALAGCAGAFVGSVSVLAWIGPGTIWPIVLVFAAATLATASIAGVGVVRGLQSVFRPR